MEKNKSLLSEYIHYVLVISFGLLMVLLSQFIISKSNPDVTITINTIYGCICLLVICLIGITISKLIKTSFPILGWVTITSLLLCLTFLPWSEFLVTSISSINFLSLTTPILTFAGISVADKLVDLGRVSHKIALVGIFVFIGTYLFSATIAQIMLSFT